MPEDNGYPKTRARNLIMLGLALGMLVASLDQTIVGTSLPKIVSELGGMSLFPWLFTAYMLAETITIPIAGKMSDRVGRKSVFLVGMVLFLAGSCLAGLATSMEQLIACRFLQGLGGGALIPMAMAAVADLYAPEERGKAQGAMGAMFALGSVIGPFLGGYLVDNIGWRWVFYVNIPIGLLAIAVTMYRYPKVAREAPKPIDYLGMGTLTTALVPALLVMTWGGNAYAWTSSEVFALSAISLVSLTVFILVERKAVDPILPLHLFRNPIFTLGSLGLMTMAMGLFGVIAFLPLFLQAVIGMSATSSGATLIPLMAGLVITIMLSGMMLQRTGYKIWLLFGPLLTAFGLVMLSTLHPGSSQTEAIIYLAIAGAGMGAVFSNYILAAQNGMDRRELGVVTSTMSLFRSIGGTVGVTVLGAVLNGRMVLELANNIPSEAASLLPGMDAAGLGALLLSPSASAALPSALLDAIRVSLSNGITHLFLLGAVIVTLAFVASAFIKSPRSEEAKEVYGTRSVEL